MAVLIDAIESVFLTDYALLWVLQQAALPRPLGGGLAVSVPGGVMTTCGTRHARLAVRAERWDRRPPVEEGWEDFDELPFSSVAGGGAVQLRGDGLVEGVGLDVDGLERARVQVYARGRHRYGYSWAGDSDEVAPEEWLFRFFPHDGPPDPLAGGPRRLAGPLKFDYQPSTGWASALLAWEQTGWNTLLSNASSGYTPVLEALYVVGRAASPAEIAACVYPWLVAPGGDDVDPLDRAVRSAPFGGVDRLASAAGMPTGTIGQSITAMTALGLLLPVQRGGEAVLVPNPAPGFVEESVELTGDELNSNRYQRVRIGYAETAEDLESAIRWAGPEGLQASVRTCAIRWATSVEAIQGALARLTAEHYDRVEQINRFEQIPQEDKDPSDPDAVFRFRLREIADDV